MATLQVEVTLAAVNCYYCGMTFGVNEVYQKKLMRDGNTFYCPAGHGNCYGNSIENELRQQLAQEAKTRERLETSLRVAREDRDRNERRRAAAQGQLTKTKNRIANGVCPICNRQFSVLHKHMTTQHPEYTKEEEA